MFKRKSAQFITAFIFSLSLYIPSFVCGANDNGGYNPYYGGYNQQQNQTRGPNNSYNYGENNNQSYAQPNNGGYNHNPYSQPNQQRFYTGEDPSTYHDLEYYPSYYHDPYYYYNPREEYGFRMSSWDYRNNWRYNKDAYLSGQTQASYYRERHPYGPGGVGYDADDDYLHLLDQVSGDHTVLMNAQKRNNEISQRSGERNKKERARYNSSNYSYEQPDKNKNSSNR